MQKKNLFRKNSQQNPKEPKSNQEKKTQTKPEAHQLFQSPNNARTATENTIIQLVTSN